MFIEIVFEIKLFKKFATKSTSKIRLTCFVEAPPIIEFCGGPGHESLPKFGQVYNIIF